MYLLGKYYTLFNFHLQIPLQTPMQYPVFAKTCTLLLRLTHNGDETGRCAPAPAMQSLSLQCESDE